MTYAYETPFCDKLSACNCPNLHNIDKNNGYSLIIINRSMGQKHFYFSIVPTHIWEDFRNLPKVNYDLRKVAHDYIKNYTGGKTSFMDLRKFHYNILCRSEMKERGAEILEGRTKSVSAKHYLTYEIDNMIEQYSKPW